MQNEATLLELGFEPYDEWCFHKEVVHYRLERDGFVFRAYVSGTEKHPFVVMGLVICDNRIVDHWRDCCSNGSVKRKIEKILQLHASV